MANWNIKKKNGENVTFNDNPRTRTTENYTQNNFIEQNTAVNGIPTNIPGYIIGRHTIIEHRIVDDTLPSKEEMEKEDKRAIRGFLILLLLFFPPGVLVYFLFRLLGVLK